MAGITHSCLKKNRSTENEGKNRSESKNNAAKRHSEIEMSADDSEIIDDVDVDDDDIIYQEKTECLEEISEILPGFLYICGMDALKDCKKMENMQISAAINCIKGAPNKKLAKRFAPSSSYLHIPVEDEDDENISKHFDQAVDFLSRQKVENRRVVVYCGLGVSRSATLVLAYLMNVQRMTLIDAYKLTRSKRPVILPNIGFFKQLIQLELKLFGKQSVNIIRPMDSNKMEVPDIVWAEVYEEVSKKFSGNCR